MTSTFTIPLPARSAMSEPDASSPTYGDHAEEDRRKECDQKQPADVVAIEQEQHRQGCDGERCSPPLRPLQIQLPRVGGTDLILTRCQTRRQTPLSREGG